MVSGRRFSPATQPNTTQMIAPNAPAPSGFVWIRVHWWFPFELPVEVRLNETGTKKDETVIQP
jgi:hypothetical protein